MCNFQTFNVGGKDYVAITRHNSDMVECALLLDTTFRGGTGVSAKPKGRFLGSDAYWQDVIQKVKTFSDYEKFIEELIETVDRVNVTHLSAAVNGKAEMKKRIINKCKDLQSLKNALSKNPFINGKVRDVDPNHILYKLAEPLPAQKGGTRSNVSFASKLCQFASKILNAGYEYSKYDSIVAKTLPVYIEHYLGVKVAKRQFSLDAKPFHAKMQIYAEYCDYIDKIIAKVNQGITREEFDHIVWYTNK
ncbi:MAG: hypothetical protein J5662_05015 [Clostridia bacterium]|nr:hypothetical protein [Clostridia bacterium]